MRLLGHLLLSVLFLYIGSVAIVAHDHHGAEDAGNHPCVTCQIIGAPADLWQVSLGPGLLSPASPCDAIACTEAPLPPRDTPARSSCPLRGPPALPALFFA